MTLETVPPQGIAAAMGQDLAFWQSVAALPLPVGVVAGQRWTFAGLTGAWLQRKAAKTRKAYFRDLADWLSWCQSAGVDVRAALAADVDAYVVARCAGLSKASTARRLAAVSSWYAYLARNDAATRNPIEGVDRPKVSRDASATVALSAAEADAFVAAFAQLTGPTARRNAALLTVLVRMGLRVGEAIGLDVADLRSNLGYRVLVVRGKGGLVRELPVTAPVAHALDAYLAERAGDAGAASLSGPMFVTATGARMDEPSVFRLVKRVAKAAGIASADQLSPHSLRHTVATLMLDARVPLESVQDALGHADPRTTRRYDRGRGSLGRLTAAFTAVAA